MTNCAVIGAPKLSEKGAAWSSSSSVNARTASAACATVPAQELERRGFRYPRLVLGMLGINFGDNPPRDVRNSLAAGDGSRGINLNRVHVGHVVHDDADRTAVRTSTPVCATPLPKALQQRQPSLQHLPRCDPPVIQRDDS